MTFILFLSWLWAFSGPEKATLTVAIEGIRPGKGDVLVALHNRAASFTEQPTTAYRLSKTKADANARTTTIEFSDLPPGDYAVSVLKDENGNRKMDFTLIGAPKEGFGVSNPPKSKFKKPQFAESKFRVSAGSNRITIRMVYF